MNKFMTFWERQAVRKQERDAMVDSRFRGNDNFKGVIPAKAGIHHRQFVVLGILIFFIVNFSWICAAESNVLSFENSFRTANKYYESGKYLEAIDEYKKILTLGFENGKIYYNMAGAYLKLGKIGEAILHYERAQLFMPRDADLKANMRFANNMVAGKNMPGKGVWYWRPLRKFIDSFTINEFTLLTVFTYWGMLFFIALSLIIKSKKRIFIVCISIATVFLLFFGTVTLQKTVYVSQSSIIISKSTDVMYGPFESATKFFTLREGNSVIVLNRRDGWSKIKRPDGKVGWLRTEDVEKVCK